MESSRQTKVVRCTYEAGFKSPWRAWQSSASVRGYVSVHSRAYHTMFSCEMKSNSEQTLWCHPKHGHCCPYIDANLFLSRPRPRLRSKTILMHVKDFWNQPRTSSLMSHLSGKGCCNLSFWEPFNVSGTIAIRWIVSVGEKSLNGKFGQGPVKGKNSWKQRSLATRKKWQQS